MTDGGSDHIEFLGQFEALETRASRRRYCIREILLLCPVRVLGGADSWVEVALYGQRKLGFLRRFFPFAHGVPSHDQLGNVFARLAAVSELFHRLGGAVYDRSARGGGGKWQDVAPLIAPPSRGRSI